MLCLLCAYLQKETFDECLYVSACAVGPLLLLFILHSYSVIISPNFMKAVAVAIEEGS